MAASKAMRALALILAVAAACAMTPAPTMSGGGMPMGGDMGNGMNMGGMGDMDMGGEAPEMAMCAMAGKAATAECANFTLVKAMDNTHHLCAAMPFMIVCNIEHYCHSIESDTGDCSPFRVYATGCADMPGMVGCSNYNGLCGEGSVVEQCTAEPPQPGAPKTNAALDAASSICAAHPTAKGCDTCKTRGDCASPITTIYSACKEGTVTDATLCAIYEDVCVNGSNAFLTKAVCHDEVHDGDHEGHDHDHDDTSAAGAAAASVLAIAAAAAILA